MKPENLQAVRALRHELHQIPERALHEDKTRACLKKWLAAHTSVQVIDRGLWFYAVRREEGASETIGFRADFDAVPTPQGCAHLCGHDGHAACLCGLILELEGQVTGKNHVFVFQPAEENGEGAKLCIPVVREQRIDRMYAVHNMPGLPKGLIYTKSGPFFSASRGMTVTMTGIQSHASNPEEGKNPSFALSRLALALEPLSAFSGFGHSYEAGTIVFDDMVQCTVVNISAGEKAFGVSPAYGEISMTLRAAHSKDLRRLEGYVQELAQGLADKYGLSCEFAFQDGFAACVNDEALTKHVFKTLGDAGFETREAPEPYRVSEDFGVLGDAVGACCLFVIGAGEDYLPLHNACYEYPDFLLEPTVTALYALANS